MIEACARCNDDPRASVPPDLQEQREPFSCNFRIGQNIFHSSQLGFWKEQRVRLPVEQAFIKDFLSVNVGAEDPEYGIGSMLCIVQTPARSICDDGDQKRLRRLDHVRKLDGPLAPLYCVEFARDWFARGGAV